jgi:succinate dehydrogenase hydrophobic anchor subunit
MFGMGTTELIVLTLLLIYLVSPWRTVALPRLERSTLRFSLNSMFIAMTIVALLLGFIIVMSR